MWIRYEARMHLTNQFITKLKWRGCIQDITAKHANVLSENFSKHGRIVWHVEKNKKFQTKSYHISQDDENDEMQYEKN